MPRLDDPEEYKIIKQIYFDEKELTDEADIANKRHKKETNQAR